MEMIAQTIKPLIVEPMRDVSQSHQLATQLIKDMLIQLEECKLQYEAVVVELSRLKHSDIDAETAILLNQELTERGRNRIRELEVKLSEKQAEINELRRNGC
jgi:predicted GNAT family acetyltransferase